MLSFTVRVVRACARYGVLLTLENPCGSRLWLDPDLRSALEAAGCRKLSWGMCSFGMPYRKPTAVYTNIAPLLAGGDRRCCCAGPHLILQGSVTTIEKGRRTSTVGPCLEDAV